MSLRTPMRLIRLTQTEHATFGQLVDADHAVIACTLELPWKDNAKGVSCIPAGQYICRRRFSPKHNCDVFGIEGVPGRSDIEIHIGNRPADTEGCVLVGSRFGAVRGDYGVLNSREAFGRFMDYMRGVVTFPLTVIDPYDQQHQPIAAD